MEREKEMICETEISFEGFLENNPQIYRLVRKHESKI